MSNPQSPLQLWGGLECTINRVGNTFFDQDLISGHRERLASDLECVATLGIRTLRTGLHWETFASTQSWQVFDERLAVMRRLRIEPIAGLLHHGSGPNTPAISTDLLDPQFPEKLAAYALEVARRYPSILSYTPINEPQTTGRFACLYGHWFPHHRSLPSYIRALYHQIRGIVLAMRAIRSVQPEARLVHTEDGGVTYSTPQLESFRVEREHRRWIGTDLLCGLVTREHALFPFLLENGLSESEILWFSENACPPSVLGLNYYVTSDRFLDHRLHLYPPHLSGGDSGSEPLVDTEAVRVHPGGIAGAGAVLAEAWNRYRLPVAVTEAHLGCHSDEQLRWLAEVWRQAQEARSAGADVRAVTVWAILGSYNWCHLCTRDTGAYEPGAFDVSSGTPVATPLANLVRDLTAGRPLSHPDLSQPGWWHHADRFIPELYSEELSGDLIGA